MGIEIRNANLRDASRIAEIIHQAFDDESDIDRVIQQIVLSNTMIDVLVVDGQVRGFVENFVTCSQDNKLWFELDLLAVHPSMQGHGIGRRLIKQSIQVAKNLNVDQIRVLIATKNDRMHHLCGSFDMTPDDFDSGLYILTPSHSQLEFKYDKSSHLIQVNTSTYSGIWIENTLSQNAIDNAQLLVKQRHLDIVGVVCAKSNQHNLKLLDNNGFNHVGDFRRWTLNL